MNYIDVGFFKIVCKTQLLFVSETVLTSGKSQVLSPQNIFRCLTLFRFSSFSWAGVRHHTSGAVFLVHHVMTSSGGAVGAQWCVPSGGGSSGLSSSMSCGSSGACGVLQPAGSLASSRRVSSLWAGSTRFLLHNGSTTGRWCVGPSATR